MQLCSLSPSPSPVIDLIGCLHHRCAERLPDASARDRARKGFRTMFGRGTEWRRNCANWLRWSLIALPVRHNNLGLCDQNIFAERRHLTFHRSCRFQSLVTLACALPRLQNLRLSADQRGSVVKRRAPLNLLTSYGHSNPKARNPLVSSLAASSAPFLRRRRRQKNGLRRDVCLPTFGGGYHVKTEEQMNCFHAGGAAIAAFNNGL